MIAKTDAIVLRLHPFSRTSHVVTWLSAAFGRVATVVKGACRPTSAFLGQYDLFATCELLFYRRDHDGLHAIRECTPLDRRDGLRHSWRRVTTASYCADLASRVALPGQEAASLFALLTRTLDDLNAGAPTPELLLRYELGVLRQAGLMPRLDICPVCQAGANPWLRFGLASGRAACAHGAAAPAAAAAEPAITVHRDVLAHLAWLAGEQAEPPPSFPSPPGAPPRHLSLGARRLLGIFIAFHLDVPPAPRRLAFELLETIPANLGT